MIRLRSLIYTLLLSLTFISSSIFATAAEILIPSYGNFGGATIEGDVFEFPTAAPESWAGFSATNEGGGPAYYPLSFSADGQLTVNAGVPSGGSATLRFVFEYQAHPNNTPSFEVTIPISGSEITTYTETLPSQGDNTYSNLVFYIVERDIPVQIQDIQVAYDDADPNAPEPGLASETTINSWNVFDGTTISEGIHEFPAAAQSWAGFANADSSAYPFSFSSPGQINFTASVPSGGTADVRFRFEYLPWPAVNPAYDTEVVTISGSTDTVYTIDIPAQGLNTFSSFLFFINDRDVPVKLGDVIVSDDAGAPTENANNVFFIFEEFSGGGASYTEDSSFAAISGNTPASYSVSFDPRNATDTLEALVLKVTGPDVSVLIEDIQLTKGSTTIGGSGNDTLVFSTNWGGESFVSNSDGNIYTHVSDGGFLLSTEQMSELTGFTLDETATITFTASIVDTPTDVVLEPLYDGETALSDGAIDTSEDTGTGRAQDPPYRWSAFVTWYNLESNNTKGSYVGDDDWGQLGDLPATWNSGVITLGPNTASYDAPGWKDPNSDDGNYFLEQTLKIEGTTGTSALLGNTVNFSGTIDSNTLDTSRYTVTAFIKALDPEDNYSEVIKEEVVLTNGSFAISATLPTGNYAPQLGFLLSGRNASPASDYGNIQISNVSASYNGPSSIPEGNFSDGANGYWAGVSGVDFGVAGGYGSTDGQVVMTNTTTNRNSVYMVSNNNTGSLLTDFGMAAGSTYDVSYYMNRISGNDLGLLQFAFNVNGNYVYVPADSTATIHDDSNTVNGEWARYVQTITVPENASEVYLYVVSGAQSTVAFDQLNASVQDFALWAANNGLIGNNAAFNADPDGDGIPNGLESFLGTAPGSSSAGISNTSKIANGFSMQHPKNANLTSDITASYQWSTDLSTWNDSGATVGGTTVSIATEDTDGTTTATATVSGSEPDNVFIKVSVSNE